MPPEELVNHFDLTKHKAKPEEIRLYFTKRNNVPEEFAKVTLHSKGIFTQATVQDFPIRYKNVYLHITRRKWLNKITGKVVTRDWDIVAKGTRITSKFTTFLKEIYK